MIQPTASTGELVRAGSRDRQWLVYAFVLVAVACTSAYAFRMQGISMRYYGDGEEYLALSEQFATGKKVTAEAPAVYRVALPWLVARTFPRDIPFGFSVFNTIAAASISLLLVMWLRRFEVSAGLQMLTALLFIASWLAPVRFVPFYPLYVDPPFLAMAVLGLLLIHRIRERWSWRLVSALTLTCFIGTLCRETMLFVPLAFAAVNVTIPSRPREHPVPLAARCLPMMAWVCAIALTRAFPFEPRYSFSLTGNALFLFRTKPLFTLPLSAFFTFGPIITLVAYEWRDGMKLLGEHLYLAVYALGCLATGYIGGHETERYWLWTAPVVYLLIARAIGRNKEALLRNAWVFVLVVGAQAVSERVFWSIPDPSSGVPAFSEAPWFLPRVWSALDRLVVIDDYFWNLWGYFGSRPFHFVQLCLDLTFAAFLVWWLRTHSSTRSATS